jgi:hypothetical protein
VDERELRERAQAHARAVVERDWTTAGSDIAPEAQDEAAAAGRLLPHPLAGAEVVRVEADEDHGIAEIAYAGDDDRVVTLRSRWEPRDGSLFIVAVEPRDDA